MGVNELFQSRVLRAKEVKEYWERYKADDNLEENPSDSTIQVHNFEGEIVDNRVNWALGKAFEYVVNQDLDESEIAMYEEQLKRFYKISQLNVLSKQYARTLLATGEACFYGYMPTGGQADDVKFMCPDINNVAFKIDGEGNVIEFARKYVGQETDGYYTYAEYVTDKNIEIYKSTVFQDLNTAWLCVTFNTVPIETKAHSFGKIPVVIQYTDEAARPAFYKVLKLIDAYNSLFASSCDQFNDFRDAYLVLRNYIMTAQEEIDEADPDRTAKVKADIREQIKKMRVLFMDGEGSAEFLTRQVDQASFVAIKKALEDNIDRFSNNLNFSDTEVMGKATNLSINTRTKPVDNAANDLCDLLEVSLLEIVDIANLIWKATNKQLDVYNITPTFYYDKPSNQVEEATTVATLVNAGVTLEDALTIFSGCNSASDWAEKSKEENKTPTSDFEITPPTTGEETTDEGNVNEE